METKPHALESEETSNKGLASCDQGVVNAKPCKQLVPEVAAPKEEEAVACAQGVVDGELCKQLEPEVAAPGEAAVACDQGVVNAKECKHLEPQVADPKEEEAVACAQGVVNAKQCKQLEPEVAAPEEAAVACAQGMVNAEPYNCKELEPVIMTNEVYLTIEDCTGELQQPLPANGDGDGATDANGSNAEITPPVEEIITEIITERGSVSSPPPEPSWGDVPDEPVTVPVTVTPRFPKRPRPAPENVEVDDVVQTMRNILMDLRNADDARLNPDDEAKVRSLLEYHPKAEEKTGSGIDYIKIKRHSTFKDVRCFWVVRTDGTETDFSYHKCLKEKVAKDHPSFVDRYDAVYRAPKRPRQA